MTETVTPAKPKTKKRKKAAPKKKQGVIKRAALWIWDKGKDIFSIPSLVFGFALGAYFF
jgi:hypothetical protein